MMSDEEYKAFLVALYQKYVQLKHRRPVSDLLMHDLQFTIERLAWVSRLVRLVQDRPQNESILQALSEAMESLPLARVIEVMDWIGILDAIEEDPRTLFGNLRRSVIPSEDAELLRQAGSLEPEAELSLIISYARNHLGEEYYQMQVRGMAKEVPDMVAHFSKMVTVDAKDVPERKKRKILNGVGKIISGAILGGGNVMMGVGGIVAPNPAIAAGVMASAAASIAAIFQGAGDLRGE